ncbi:MAG: hypothetical protein GT589_02810 [Peptoclostridium sp.]|uniref:DUF169 domain-containing protein n=1 Tax=Peptoclostridium sp. TaxID=1904860 RepID=UPI00139EA8DF|nr:DUF169 domain-containing protein [Peptoclostridium sp.]MZQ75070.1 hypothetical protein [Peptoclostridium sp.]
MYKKEIDKLYILLEMDKSIVGIKFLYSEAEYENSKIGQSKNMLSYCMMVKIASSGKPVKVKKANFKCNSSARVLGLVESSDYVDSGKEYYSYNMYGSLETAKKVHDDVAYMSKKIYGLIAQPIEEFEEKPDVAIMISNPYNVMRMLQGYAYTYGMAKKIGCAGNQGVCSELTARPYEANDLNVSVLCSNTRFSCRWNDGDMGVAMPFEMFSKVVDGVMATANAAEPDERKADIIKRANEKGLSLDILLGENYYGSSIGVAKLGK